MVCKGALGTAKADICWEAQKGKIYFYFYCFLFPCENDFREAVASCDALGSSLLLTLCLPLIVQRSSTFLYDSNCTFSCNVYTLMLVSDVQNKDGWLWLFSKSISSLLPLDSKISPWVLGVGSTVISSHSNSLSVWILIGHFSLLDHLIGIKFPYQAMWSVFCPEFCIFSPFGSLINVFSILQWEQPLGEDKY